MTKETCTNCDGSGMAAIYGDIDQGIEETEGLCDYCDGNGYIEYDE